MDDHEVGEVLAVPMHGPFVAVVVHKDVLVDVQVVLPAVDLTDDGAHRLDQRVFPCFVLPVATDVAAVNGLRSWTAQMAGQARNLVLGELRKKDN